MKTLKTGLVLVTAIAAMGLQSVRADQPRMRNALRHLRDARAALYHSRAAIVASHSGTRAWLDLAIFLRHANRLDEMEQALRTLESSPVDHPESVMDGASLLLRTGRNYALGVRLLRRYLLSPVEEGPAFKAHDLLGQLLEKQGDRSAAAEEFRAALALSRTYARAQEDLKRVEH